MFLPTQTSITAAAAAATTCYLPCFSAMCCVSDANTFLECVPLLLHCDAPHLLLCQRTFSGVLLSIVRYSNESVR